MKKFLILTSFISIFGPQNVMAQAADAGNGYYSNNGSSADKSWQFGNGVERIKNWYVFLLFIKRLPITN